MGILTLLRNAFGGRSRKGAATEAEGAVPSQEATEPKLPSPANEPTPATAASEPAPAAATVPEPRTTTLSTESEHELVAAAFDKVTVPMQGASTKEEPESTEKAGAKATEPEPASSGEPVTGTVQTTEASDQQQAADEATPEQPTTASAVPGEEQASEEGTAESGASAEVPATEKPDAQEAAAEKQVVEEPTAQEAAAEKQVVEEPTAQEPVVEEPDAEKPAAQKPVAAESASEGPVSEKAAPEKSATEEPASEEPAAEAPAPEKPAAEEPASEEPVAEAEPASEVEATPAEPEAEEPAAVEEAKPRAAKAEPAVEPEPEAAAEAETAVEPEPATEDAPDAEPEAAPEPETVVPPKTEPQPAAEVTAAAAADGEDAPQESPADDETVAGGAGGNTETVPPTLRTAYDAAEATLSTHNLTGTTARTYLVLDRSASMRPYYKDGSAQALGEQTLALAAHLDPESKVHVVFFSTELDGTGELTLTDHENKIDELHAGLGRMGRTSYHAAVEAVLAHHTKESADSPALVVFQTDGAPDAKTPATQALTEAAKSHPAVFFSFVAFGDPENKAFDYLRKLKLPNTSHFLAGETPKELTDAEIYEGILANWRP